MTSLRVILRIWILGLYLGAQACSGGGGDEGSDPSPAVVEENSDEGTLTDDTGSSAEVDPTEPPSVVETYSVGGTVTGVTGSSIIIQNNSSDSLVVSADGSFNFQSE